MAADSMVLRSGPQPQDSVITARLCFRSAMTKGTGEWLAVSFTNVKYALPAKQ
jgi:hypothetical protein